MVIKELFARIGFDLDQDGFNKVEAALGGLKMGMVAIGATAAGVAAGLMAVAQSVAEDALKADALASELGITAEAVQELGEVADEVFVSEDVLYDGLRRLAMSAGAAAEGSQEAARGFAKLGVSITPGNLPKLDELFETLGDKFKNMPPGIERTRLAMQMFGRAAGTKLLKVLDQGTDAIKALRQAARDSGQVLGKEGVAAAKEYTKAVHDFGDTIKALKYSIGVPLLKALVGMQKGVSAAIDGFLAWKKKNINGILQGIKFAVFALTAALIAYGVVNAGAIAATIAGWVVMAAGAVASAAVVAAAWIAANLPIIAIGLAILGVIAILEDLYQFLTGGESVIGDAVEGFKAHFDGYWDFMKSLFRWLIDVFFGDAILQAVDVVAEAIFTKLTGAWDKVREFFKHPIDAVFGSKSPGFSGGASSPSASAGSAVNAGGKTTIVAPNQSASFVVNAGPGQDPKAIASEVRSAWDEWQASQLREAHAGVP